MLNVCFIDWSKALQRLLFLDLSTRLQLSITRQAILPCFSSMCVLNTDYCVFVRPLCWWTAAQTGQDKAVQKSDHRVKVEKAYSAVAQLLVTVSCLFLCMRCMSVTEWMNEWIKYYGCFLSVCVSVSVLGFLSGKVSVCCSVAFWDEQELEGKTARQLTASHTCMFTVHFCTFQSLH